MAKEQTPGGNGYDPDGIDHNGLLRYIEERGGIKVIDNKRNDIPAFLTIMGVNGDRRLVIFTGSDMKEAYPEDDRAAIEKILTMMFIEKAAD